MSSKQKQHNRHKISCVWHSLGLSIVIFKRSCLGSVCCLHGQKMTKQAKDILQRAQEAFAQAHTNADLENQKAKFWAAMARSHKCYGAWPNLAPKKKEPTVQPLISSSAKSKISSSSAARLWPKSSCNSV